MNNIQKSSKPPLNKECRHIIALDFIRISFTTLIPIKCVIAKPMQLLTEKKKLASFDGNDLNIFLSIYGA